MDNGLVLAMDSRQYHYIYPEELIMAHPWRYRWLILGVALIGVGTTLEVNADSRDILTPHQQEIQDNLPPGMQMRLPSQVMLSHPSSGEGRNYRVRVFSFTSPKGLMVSLFSCDSGSPSCLVGSFSADSQRSVDAQAALKQHQTGGSPITLTQGVRGYLLEGHLQNPPTRLSSVMWEQDGQIYTVRFLASERQNILYMAYSMAHQTPIRSAATTATVPSNPGLPSPVVPNLPAPSSQTSPIPATGEPQQMRIPVHKIEVIGSSVFSPEELNSITQPLEGRSVTLNELNSVADAITKLYLSEGYVTSNAVLVEKDITDGIVKIQVIEGRLQDIRVEGNQRLNDSYIRQRIQRGVTMPLQTNSLEKQLRLLSTDPLIASIQASLQPGEIEGQTLLVVEVVEAEPFEGSINVDNYSPPSLGSERTGVNVRYGNLTGIGDEIAGSYYRSTTGGVNIWEFSYRAPVNSLNGTLQLRTVIDRNEVTQGIGEEFDIQGQSEEYEISFRQPIIRSLQEELALSLAFSHQDGQTFLGNEAFGFGSGPDEDGVSRTSVFRLGQDYTRRDEKGVWVFLSQFNIGTGLFDATSNDDPIPDGRFFSWLGQIQRIQPLDSNNLLIIQGSLQLTPDPLLSSEQFVIGGGQSLRGYRHNVRAGDNGFRFSIENRITLERNQQGVASFQLAPFIDLGAVWNQSDNPNNEFLPDQRFLGSVGLGLLWEPLPHLNLGLDYAIPFFDLDDRGENAQDEGFYFNVNYGF